MDFLSDNLKKKILIIVFILLVFFHIKPSISFKPNGKPRLYGFGKDLEGYKKTIYTIPNIIVFLVVLIYFLKI